ncbi:MAG: hypothetical protein AAFY06_02375 [Pseudomonadota bacterium]
MTRRYFRLIKEETIASVLHYLRQEAEREGFDTLAHIDAILASRGVDPETLQTPRKTPKAFAKGELQRKVLEALREPRTGPEIVRAIDSPLSYKETYRRVYIVLHRLKGRGLVRREGREWYVSPLTLGNL